MPVIAPVNRRVLNESDDDPRHGLAVDDELVNVARQLGMKPEELAAYRETMGEV